MSELLLPFVLAYRVVKGQMSVKFAWWLMDTWLPCKKFRRVQMHFRLWRARRYRGKDEFHRSLDLDGWAMLQMTGSEQKAYVEDLVVRRNKAHMRQLESAMKGAEGK